MGIFNLSPNETHREKQTNDIERGSDETVKHSGNQVSSDVTPYEARFDQQNHDIERGSDKVTKHKAHKFSLDAYSTSPPYHATVMYEAMYHSLMFTPWILSTILREKLTYPTIRGSPSQRGVSASSIAGGLTAIVLGAAIEAPLAAGAACLHNVTGSWLMRMHHSHDDFAFHGGSAQGNYALAGALSMLPAMAMLVMARPRFDDNRTGLLVLGVTYLMLHFAFSPAVGAVAAAIGAARGFEMQTVTNSTVANVAGMSFIVMVLFPFGLNVYLFFAFFDWLLSGL